MQNVTLDISANSATSPALQEGLVTDVVADVPQSALLNTVTMSVDVILEPNTLPN